MLKVEGDFGMVDCGKRLRILRQAMGLTQKRLAEQLGLTKSVVSAYETDLRLPSYDVLIKIASIFSTTLDYLLGMGHHEVLDISGLSEEDQKMLIQLVYRLRKS